VRIATTGDDGLPLVRYGFVGGSAGRNGPVVVMLDGEIGGDVVDLCSLQPVTITTVELRLTGADLCDDPDLRRGLVALWQAEADQAGLSVEALHPIGDGVRDSSDSWALAELTSGGEHYMVRAIKLPNDPDVISIKADNANSWHL
jgi:hypothetical protein